MSLSPSIRQLQSPLTPEQLTPLDPRCETVQFGEPLTEDEHRCLSEFLKDYPNVSLRAFCLHTRSLPNLTFLRHYPFLKSFAIDDLSLESTDGAEFLPDALEYFSFGQTRSKKLSLEFLGRFKDLRELYLESHIKGIEVLSRLAALERLTLRSITLPDLAVLLPLRNLWSLDIKLGGTKDLSLLSRIGRLKYLELWMVKGLQGIEPVGEIDTLQNLFLESLKNVAALPSFRKLRALRRVTLDNLKGISDLKPIAEAPALEELFVVRMNQLQAENFRPFVGHQTLRCATIGLGSARKSAQAEALLGLRECDGFKGEFAYR